MKKYITTTKALEIIKQSWLKNSYKPNLPSLITWIKKYNLGYKFCGRWQVDEEKLKEFIKKGIKK
ncbi:MAG TPA: hypothetical protein VMV95_00805 [Bacillota bacterium]|nr:hypothetical protein [Bacillota bacterium]